MLKAIDILRFARYMGFMGVISPTRLHQTHPEERVGVAWWGVLCETAGCLDAPLE